MQVTIVEAAIPDLTTNLQDPSHPASHFPTHKVYKPTNEEAIVLTENFAEHKKRQTQNSTHPSPTTRTWTRLQRFNYVNYIANLGGGQEYLP